MCSVCPLRRYIVRPAAYRAAGGKRPDVWRRGGRPVLFFCRVCSVRPFVRHITRPVPFVQQEAKASTHPRPRLMNCTAPDMDKYRQHGQPPNIEEIIRHAPNMDNMDNVDNRPAAGKEEAAPCCSFAPCAAFALSLDVSPAPFFSYSRRPKPQHRQDRRGGAASKRRPIWQRPALRLYDTRTTARALRIENAPKDEESGAGAASTQPARI